jgi:hypothetical protein
MHWNLIAVSAFQSSRATLPVIVDWLIRCSARTMCTL